MSESQFNHPLPYRRNRGGYRGETIDIDRIQARIRVAAAKAHWVEYREVARSGVDLFFFSRMASPASERVPNLYLSAGIHGDEPAGVLTVLELLENNQWPEDSNVWICSCLNPTGFRSNTRESDQGLDLNRDYKSRRSGEVLAHLRWLENRPKFDLSICLHEDWEATGCYLYELNLDGKPSSAEEIVRAMEESLPIESATWIDGRESSERGIIRPNPDPSSRPEWPEALHLVMNHTRLSYTLESSSDFALPLRVKALRAGVQSIWNTSKLTSQSSDSTRQLGESRI